MPLIDVTTRFNYEAAHWLPNVRKSHQCGRMHGHSYELQVTMRGPVDPYTGWVVDFADIKDKVRPWLHRLDHRTLNDEIENPTVENQLLWWWERLDKLFFTSSIRLQKLRLQETPNNYAELVRQ